ncbi:hypothetical protein DRO48_03035, partial [Candidatus Bathyarchaeota archaeon]
NFWMTLALWVAYRYYQRYMTPFLRDSVAAPILKLYIREKRRRASALDTFTSALRFVGYALFFIGLVAIWAPGIGQWMLKTLGTVGLALFSFFVGIFTSGVLGNIIAYEVIRSTQPYKVGDFVKVGDTYGEVVYIDYIFTRIRSVKNELISVPHLLMLSREITNYSRRWNPIIHVDIPTQHEADPKEVEKILLSAVRKTEGLLNDGEHQPFVLVKEVKPAYVVYELNAYLDNPKELIKVRSSLLREALTALRKAGVEITSPTPILMTSKREKSK